MKPDFDIEHIPHKPWVYQFKDKKGVFSISEKQKSQK